MIIDKWEEKDERRGKQTNTRGNGIKPNHQTDPPHLTPTPDKHAGFIKHSELWLHQSRNCLTWLLPCKVPFACWRYGASGRLKFFLFCVRWTLKKQIFKYQLTSQIYISKCWLIITDFSSLFDGEKMSVIRQKKKPVNFSRLQK